MYNNAVNTPKVNMTTILRTAALVFALTNQVCHSLGKPFLPIDDEETQSLVTILLTVGAAMSAWWHNNSFTKHARHADNYLKTRLRGDHTKEGPDHAD